MTLEKLENTDNCQINMEDTRKAWLTLIFFTNYPWKMHKKRIM